MSKLKPMLFSTLMVQALLNETKTQTRRIVKEKIPMTSEKFPDIIPQWEMEFHEVGKRFARLKHVYNIKKINQNANRIESFYHDINCKIVVGDIIWVRETFANFGEGFIYRADELPEFNDLDIKWKPSLFMPKNACRLFLQVTKVRIERLNDITENDAIQEGLIFSFDTQFELDKPVYKNYFLKQPLKSKKTKKNYYTNVEGWYRYAKDSYKSLWEFINGSHSWEENPFVWVYTFKVVERPENFC